MEDFIAGGGAEGFIYVSFGSAAKLSSGPKYLQDLFFRAFKNSKIRFLWRWEGSRPANMPENVYTAEWMPQQAILG